MAEIGGEMAEIGGQMAENAGMQFFGPARSFSFSILKWQKYRERPQILRHQLRAVCQLARTPCGLGFRVLCVGFDTHHKYIRVYI